MVLADLGAIKNLPAAALKMDRASAAMLRIPGMPAR